MQRLIIAGVLTAMAAPAAIAQHTDIEITIADNAINTGLRDVDGGDTVTSNVRVFTADMGLTSPFFAGNPGFNSSGVTELAGAVVSFEIVGAVLEYDADNDAFVVPEDDVRLFINKGQANVITPAGDDVVPGFGVGLVSGTGGMHEHVGYTLITPSVTLPSSDRQGIFVLRLRLTTNASGVDPSEDVLLLFNRARPSDELEDAQALAQEILEPVVNLCGFDLNNDGSVDGADFGAFGAAFGSNAGDPEYDASMDADGNGSIDGADFGAFGAEFGRADCLP